MSRSGTRWATLPAAPRPRTPDALSTTCHLHPHWRQLAAQLTAHGLPFFKSSAAQDSKKRAAPAPRRQHAGNFCTGTGLPVVTWASQKSKLRKTGADGHPSLLLTGQPSRTGLDRTGKIFQAGSLY
ncbi:unnamed protein product [Calypogeia fissa]